MVPEEFPWDFHNVTGSSGSSGSSAVAEMDAATVGGGGGGNASVLSVNSSVNASSLDCNPEQKLVNELWVQLLFSFLYTIIFFVGVFGNVLVSLVVILNKHMKNVTNLFIVNLAISDVVMCLFAVPFTPLDSFTGQWYFGDILCKLFPFSQVHIRKNHKLL